MNVFFKHYYEFEDLHFCKISMDLEEIPLKLVMKLSAHEDFFTSTDR